VELNGSRRPLSNQIFLVSGSYSKDMSYLAEDDFIRGFLVSCWGVGSLVSAS
jgi:hypothetical protein